MRTQRSFFKKLLCYAYSFALLKDVFYLRTKKRKNETKTEKTKMETIGGGYKWERNTNTSAWKFSFHKPPFIKNRLWGSGEKTYFFRGQKRGKRGQKEKKFMSLNVDCRKLGQKNKR